MLRRFSRRLSLQSSGSPVSLPVESPSFYLMEKVVDFANERGGADEYHPWMLTDMMQTAISFAHTHLPVEFGWLGAVAVTAIGVRSLVFPLCIESIRQGRMKSSLLPQYSEMLKEMAEMKVPSSSNPKASERLQTVQKKYIAFTAKYGNVALKGTLASAIQIPMIMTGIVACNGIAMHPEIFPSVALDAPLWLTSAALPDPLYVLPAINAGLVAFNMSYFGSIDATANPASARSGGKSQQQEQADRIKDLITSRMGRDSAERTSQQIDAMYKSKFMQYGKKLFPLLIFGITAKFPAITLVYTISNIGGAMVQNWLITSVWFQRVFDIPPQAKRSQDQVAEALQRANEIRAKIDSLVAERHAKRREAEQAARSRFKRRNGH
jgi:membrane protein insertase Oxa1/YidC/SpoIIIJ